MLGGDHPSRRAAPVTRLRLAQARWRAPRGQVPVVRLKIRNPLHNLAFVAG